MAEKSKEGWPNEALDASPEVTPAPDPAAPQTTREAMSWIRALANDWEDTRSHSEASK